MEQVPSITPMAKIWTIVAMIPQGKVASYGKIADYAGLPGRARYVSRALKQAPKKMQLPWQRVVNSQGKISFKLDTHEFRQQQELLRLDGVIVNRGRINLSEYEWQPDLATLVLSMPF